MIKKLLVLIVRFFFPHSRVFWLLLFLGFMFYEACGLYFQYVLKLNPCIECVYERACFMFFGVAAIFGMLHCKNIITRLIPTAIWAVSSGWGLLIALEHRGYELTRDDPFAASCGLVANFPSWFKLDVWLPAVFAPTGICGDATWSFAGLTMVQWIIIIYICNLAVAGLFILLSLIPQSKYDFWAFHRY